MSKHYQTSLFIFRRDLRLEDNTGLMAALAESQQVIPCFIFDPRQISTNKYKSEASLQFMVESLRDLEEQLTQKQGKLFYFSGEAETVIQELLKETKIDAIYLNKDYTPFSLKRDQALEKICEQHHIAYHGYDDILLQPPGLILKADGSPYKVFTHFYNNAKKFIVPLPQPNTAYNYFTGNLTTNVAPSILEKILPQFNSNIAVNGGRKNCLTRLKEISNLSNYAQARDFPAKTGTTLLSAHLKFTTCSPREIYHAFKKSLPAVEILQRELYWRDFFTLIGFYFPHVYGHNFDRSFDQLVWHNNKALFSHWCEGTTGFPIVDAGMRQLNATGYMHNRVRMITASFLIKDLHINWRWGERYFAQHLVDYDPAVNNGNWQWCASTGCDAQPYFRIFNPWLQQQKFDPDCDYIKHWLPELKSVDKKILHHWYEDKYIALKLNYPRPIIDHSNEAKIAIAEFKAIK